MNSPLQQMVSIQTRKADFLQFSEVLKWLFYALYSWFIQQNNTPLSSLTQARYESSCTSNALTSELRPTNGKRPSLTVKTAAAFSSSTRPHKTGPRHLFRYVADDKRDLWECIPPIHLHGVDWWGRSLSVRSRDKIELYPPPREILFKCRLFF